jgi:hypothetical protein
MTVPPSVREAAGYTFLSLRTRSPPLSTHLAGWPFSMPRAWASARGIETVNRPCGRGKQEEAVGRGNYIRNIRSPPFFYAQCVRRERLPPNIGPNGNR